MKPLMRIGYLIDQHPSLYKQYKNTSEAVEYTQCTGCPACDQIEQLSIANGLKSTSKNAKGPTPRKRKEPTKKQEVVKVDKTKPRGTDITKEEMKAMLDKGMSLTDIAKEKNVAVNTMYRRQREWFPEYKKIRKPKKFSLTQEEVLKLWNEGKSRRQIAEVANASNKAVEYWINKWQEEDGFTLPERPKKTKVAATNKYDSLMDELKNKLKLANKENDGLKAFKEKLESKIEEYEEVVKLKDEQNLQLVKRNQQIVTENKKLQMENQNLHAAAEDTEKEAAATREKIQTEESYLVQIADKDDLIDRYQRDLDIYEKANKDLQNRLVDNEEILELTTELLKKVL